MSNATHTPRPSSTVPMRGLVEEVRRLAGDDGVHARPDPCGWALHDRHGQRLRAGDLPTLRPTEREAWLVAMAALLNGETLEVCP